ncbi:MAG: hypothetical protein ABI666_10435 [Ferruginibacter sp.]
MLDEEMDHIIKDAVDKHHPAYNDKAWEKMEKKLDKHLPQKTDRKRYLFFLLLFLLLGGGAFFGINYLNREKTSVNKEIAESKKNEQARGGNKKDEQPVAQNATPGDNSIENSSEENKVHPVDGDIKNLAAENVPDKTTGSTINNTGNNDISLPKTKNNNKAENTQKNKMQVVKRKGRSNIRITSVNPSDESVDPSDEIAKAEKEKAKNNITKKRKADDKKNVVITAATPENNEAENTSAVPADLKKNSVTLNEQKAESIKAKEDKKEVKAKEVAVTENKISSSSEKKKSKKNVAGNFGITVSAGPDLSFIKLNKLGKTTLMYGAGLSYQFKNRITVRAGFYSAKKIYSAAPDQYKSQPGTTYPYLDGIDADCRVYEIPVSLSYNFGIRKNHNWFGNVGLSSYLMKTEDYDYNYKVPYYGQGYTYYTYKAAIKNENKHYFAVLTLSAGYQYNFNKRISMQAEPYIKLPLAGVGDGKIKLKSAGVLFTVTVKPFAKKNK